MRLALISIGLALSCAAADLPGRGLSQHPFVYCGEGNNTVYVVKDGRVSWSHTFDEEDELDDVAMLSNGNILVARRWYVTEMSPDKKIVWNYEGPPGTEIHCAQPVGKDKVLFMQSGNPAKLILMNKRTGKVEKELILPVAHRHDIHPQFRHVRMTKAGTFLAAHLDMSKVAEYDANGKEIWSVAAPVPWSAVRLKNGNTLIGGNHRGYVREVNPKGETVWEINKNDLPGITLRTVQQVSRLANGNTLICNHAPEKTIPQVIEVTPDKKVVWALLDRTNLGPATAIQLLDEPGIEENGDLPR